MGGVAPNTLVVLGPTASGKTSLGVHLAHALSGEVVSADSRQVYRGLDIGSGKDLDEYVVNGEAVPYHLIDIVDLGTEFSVYDYQRACFSAIEALWARERLPVVVGGTGLYLEAVLKGYRMVEAPENPELRGQLASLTDAELVDRLTSLRPDQHNVTDTTDRERTIRAIEIVEAERVANAPSAPSIRPFILGTRWPREVLRQRIESRLTERLRAGLVEEVEGLLATGIPPKRLRLLGLEYRFVTDYLSGDIKNRNDLFQKLAVAIRQFAKRQETWFRRMERNGMEIHWIAEADYDAARTVVESAFTP